MSEHRRKFTLAAVAMVALPLIVVATAYACARLATVKLDRATAREGTTITAIGRNFNSAANASTVKVRFNSRNGKVLWEGRPDGKGRFRATFKMPSSAPGYYVILATQTVASGAPAAGTPGRAPIRVKAASSSRSTAVSPVPTGGATPGDPGMPAGISITLLLAALAGGALTLSARRRTTSPSLTQ